MDEYFSSTVLNVYKAFKVSVRGTKAVGQDTVFDNARKQLFEVIGFTLSVLADSAHQGNESDHFDAVEAADKIVKAEPAVEVLLKKDEDSLPTVMENISFAMNGDTAADALSTLLTESEEHLILSGLWFAGAHAQPDLALYEISRVKTQEIRMVQFRCAAEMFRSVLYLNNKWPYHAEKSADDLLALCESQKAELIISPWPALDANGNMVTPEQALHQLRALAYALRGSAREECEEDEKHEQAIDDFAMFVSEANAGGLDHAVVDLAGLMVALQKENNDDALKYVQKLEARPNLSPDEKELVAEIKGYVVDKKEEEAEDVISDNHLLSSFAGTLLGSQFQNIPVIKELHATAAGKKFVGITQASSDVLLAGSNAVDSLKKDAEGVMDKIIK